MRSILSILFRTVVPSDNKIRLTFTFKFSKDSASLYYLHAGPTAPSACPCMSRDTRPGSVLRLCKVVRRSCLWKQGTEQVALGESSVSLDFYNQGSEQGIHHSFNIQQILASCLLANRPHASYSMSHHLI